MAFWWVNNKQTHRHEIGGGYIWSPKASANGSYNRFYANMRLVTPGDLVFAYYDARIQDVGIATRPAASCRKPPEFGRAGEGWAEDGWLVPVEWHRAPAPLRPKDIINELRPHLPDKYAPLNRATGDGLQNVYLAAVPDDMAAVLLARLGAWGAGIVGLARGTGDDDGAVRRVDDALEEDIRRDPGLDETERRAVINARRGQGRFRLAVEARERGCRITGVADTRLLRASHIKRWRSCATNRERLDGDNGLLLCPNVDLLFDRGYMSFEDDGRVLASPAIDAGQLRLPGVPSAPPPNVGPFSAGQAAYLAFHRANVFLHGR